MRNASASSRRRRCRRARRVRSSRARCSEPIIGRHGRWQDAAHVRRVDRRRSTRPSSAAATAGTAADGRGRCASTSAMLATAYHGASRSAPVVSRYGPWGTASTSPPPWSMTSNGPSGAAAAEDEVAGRLLDRRPADRHLAAAALGGARAPAAGGRPPGPARSRSAWAPSVANQAIRAAWPAAAVGSSPSGRSSATRRGRRRVGGGDAIRRSRAVDGLGPLPRPGAELSPSRRSAGGPS